MPATVEQRSEPSATAEPNTDGRDWAIRWNAWARTPEGREELKRQALEALEFYDRVLKPRHEPHDIGKFIVVDRETKEYELAPTSVEARRRLLARGVEGDFITLEVGHPLVFVGTGSVLESPDQ